MEVWLRCHGVGVPHGEDSHNQSSGRFKDKLWSWRGWGLPVLQSSLQGFLYLWDIQCLLKSIALGESVVFALLPGLQVGKEGGVGREEESQDCKVQKRPLSPWSPTMCTTKPPPLPQVPQPHIFWTLAAVSTWVPGLTTTGTWGTGWCRSELCMTPLPAGHDSTGPVNDLC